MEALEARVVAFCRFLREGGITVTPSESIDAVSAVALTGLSDRRVFHDSLRAATLKRAGEYPAFERLFDAFWSSREANAALKETEGQTRKPSGAGDADGPSGASQDEGNAGRDRHSRGDLFAAYSPQERLSKRRFVTLDQDGLPELRRGVKRLGATLATREGRRRVRSRSGELDLPSTVRASLSTGGHIYRLLRERRKLSRSRLVLVCDISGSMDAHRTELLKVIHTVQNRVPQARVFAFSTRLTSMWRYLKGRSLWGAAEEVSENLDFWSSGTRIGAALGVLLREHPSALRRNSVVVIISDGWELGELNVLQENLYRIRAMVRGVVWLNPLADSPEFRPSSMGMKAAMPHIDLLCGLNVLSDRREFERMLGGLSPGLESWSRPPLRAISHKSVHS